MLTYLEDGFKSIDGALTEFTFLEDSNVGWRSGGSGGARNHLTNEFSVNFI